MSFLFSYVKYKHKGSLNLNEGVACEPWVWAQPVHPHLGEMLNNRLEVLGGRFVTVVSEKNDSLDFIMKLNFPIFHTENVHTFSICERRNFVSSSFFPPSQWPPPHSGDKLLGQRTINCYVKSRVQKRILIEGNLYALGRWKGEFGEGINLVSDG